MVTLEARRPSRFERRQLSGLEAVRKTTARIYPNGIDMATPQDKRRRSHTLGNAYEQQCFDAVRGAYPELFHIGPNFIDYTFSNIPFLHNMKRPDIISCERANPDDPSSPLVVRRLIEVKTQKSDQTGKAEGFCETISLLREHPGFLKGIVKKAVPYSSLGDVDILIPENRGMRVTFIYPCNGDSLVKHPQSKIPRERWWVPLEGNAIATRLWEGYYAPVRKAA